MAGVSFNQSLDPTVDSVKTKTAAFVDELHAHRNAPENAGNEIKKRFLDHAEMNLIDAHLAPLSPPCREP